MNAQDIINAASLHCDDDEIPQQHGLAWINECLQVDLGTDSQAEGKTTIAVTDPNEWYDLPGDFLHIRRIGHLGDDLTRDYQVESGQIRFPYTGTYFIRYFKRPALITNPSQIPDCHPALHYALVLWVASRYKSADDDENRDAQRLMADYYEAKARVIFQTKRQSGRFAVVRLVDEVY